MRAPIFEKPGLENLHCISTDRTHGGQLLKCSGKGLRPEIQREGNYCIALPETFLKAGKTIDNLPKRKMILPVLVIY
jgi:hypothetical protein